MTPTSRDAAERHLVRVTRTNRPVVTGHLVCIGGRGQRASDRATVLLPSGAHLTVALAEVDLIEEETADAS